MQAGHRSPAAPARAYTYLSLLFFFLQNILFSVVYLGSLIYVP
jgi:hypothetical protein